MKIFVLLSRFPYPLDKGDKLRAYYQIKELSAFHEIHLCCLDDNNIPKSYKMNVPSMKMNEVPATWDGWITTESGALLPTSHTFSSGNTLSMGTVKGYN
jgi:hypothetical protein